MSTRRRLDVSGPLKKINSWVRPGVLEVRARALRPVSALISEDLPTLERPANAISGPAIGGSEASDGAAATKSKSPANRRRPGSVSVLEKSSANPPPRRRAVCLGLDWVGLAVPARRGKTKSGNKKGDAVVPSLPRGRKQA